MPTRPPARISTFAPVLHLEVLSVLRSGLLASGALLILRAGLYLWLIALTFSDTAPGQSLAGFLTVTGSPLALVAGLLIGGTDWVAGLRSAVEFHRLALRTDASVLRALLLARVVVWTAWFLQFLPLLFLVTALGGVSAEFLASAGLVQFGLGLLGIFLRWILTLLVAGGATPVRLTLGVLLAWATNMLLMEHLRHLRGALVLVAGPLDSSHVGRMLLGTGVFGALACFGWRTLEQPAPSIRRRDPPRPQAWSTERPDSDTYLARKERRWPQAVSWFAFPALVGFGWSLHLQPGLVLGLVLLHMFLEGINTARDGFYRELEDDTWEALRLLPTPPAAFVLQKLAFFHELQWLSFATGVVLLPLGLDWDSFGSWIRVALFQALPLLCALHFGRCWVRNWSYRLMLDAIAQPVPFPRIVSGAFPRLILPALLMVGGYLLGLLELAAGLLFFLVLVRPDLFARVTGIDGNPALSRLIHAVEEPPAEPGKNPARWMD